MDLASIPPAALREATERWLTQFEAALRDPDEASLRRLFHAESHWRDALALTWSIGTVSEAAALVPALRRWAGQAAAREFRLAATRTPPRRVTRAGSPAIEAFFEFATRVGRCNGVLRLTPDGDALKAWTLLTALEAIDGHEEHIGRARPSGESYSRDFRGPNWLDQRLAAARYDGRDPAVLVVGGGHAGLSIAARLTQLGVDTLVVDRWPRIGDNWRQRYHALTLHNQVQVNHLPYLPFPPSFPTYIPKDKLANWFEAYVDALEINYWPGTEFEGGTYDDEAGRWRVVLRRDGAARAMHPRHVVLATGVSGIPVVPELPGLRDFRGAVMHSSQYDDGERWRGKRALVIGTGNSGHDIAQDLHSAGCAVTLVQRNPTLITNIEPSAQLAYALYDEGPPTEDCDLITVSVPLSLLRKAHQGHTARSKELDRPLLEALARIGFKLDFGRDATGWQFLYLERGGGYYFNVGCSDLLVEGKVGLAQFADIETFAAEGARLKSGATLAADLVVLATGYLGQEALVKKLFGAEVAARVGPIWGFGAGQELRNMFVRTPQPGLWFIAGSLAQCRIYSKYLGLQIQASELGLLPAAAAPAAALPA
jgi:cation diffusion facilitator CzcD-associated flavoprotein CzcO